MYLAHVTLFCVMCVISEQSTFDRSGQGITDVTLPAIPGGTTVVDFGYNLMSFVPRNYFKSLSSLIEISLHSNDITDIADSAFSAVPTVTFINLGWNQLTVIRKLMFQGLPNLEKLWMASNQIYKLEPGSFKDNMALYYLSLWNNQLENICESIFAIDNHPTNLYIFKIFSNALECNSALCWLLMAEAAGWITVYDQSSTECARPGALAGRKWDSLTEQDLGCGNSLEGMTIPVDNFGTVVGENPDCLLLSGTVVGENPDHVCWDKNNFLYLLYNEARK